MVSQKKKIADSELLLENITAKLTAERNIKLIWDFRGPDAKKIAAHYLIHLDEFIEREKLANHKTGIEHVNDSYTITYMTLSESGMILVRDALKPHRGEYAD